MSWKSFNRLTNINASLSPSGALSVFVEILEDVNHPFAHAEIYADSGTGQYDFEVINRTVDICKFFHKKRYEPLLQLVYKTISENGAWPTSCPIRKVVVSFIVWNSFLFKLFSSLVLL